MANFKTTLSYLLISLKIPGVFVKHVNISKNLTMNGSIEISGSHIRGKVFRIFFGQVTCLKQGNSDPTGNYAKTS